MYTREKNFRNKKGYKTLGEIWKICKKIYNFLTRDWGTVEKIKQKLEDGIRFE